jgi:proteasome lid subunit RPN8/RPN11
MLQIPQPLYDQIRRHGESAYPHESCGVLLGQLNDPGHVATRTITHAIPVPNRSATPARHYEIDPKDLVRILREASPTGLEASPEASPEILGFYHSHPDHPAQPSPTDLAEAHWLGSSYLITAIDQGTATSTNSFHLTGPREEDKHFEPEELHLLP